MKRTQKTTIKSAKVLNIQTISLQTNKLVQKITQKGFIEKGTNYYY